MFNQIQQEEKASEVLRKVLPWVTMVGFNPGFIGACSWSSSDSAKPWRHCFSARKNLNIDSRAKFWMVKKLSPSLASSTANCHMCDKFQVSLVKKLSEARRVGQKSPMAAMQKREKKVVNRLGIGRLENGEPFIHGWPVERRPPSLEGVPSQSVVEAANWIGKVRCF